MQTLEEDRERLAASTAFPAMDRYIALIYPVMATAADYFPEDAVVVLSESPRVAEPGKELPVAVGRGRQGPDGAGRSWPGSWLTSPHL